MKKIWRIISSKIFRNIIASILLIPTLLILGFALKNLQKNIFKEAIIELRSGQCYSPPPDAVKKVKVELIEI